jgi:hypothetical protein
MFRRFVYWVAFVVAIGAGAAGGHAGFDVVQVWLSRASSPDQALAALQEMPLLGVVIKEFPEAQAQLRAAIEHDRDNPPKLAASQTFLAGLEIRRTYIAPALRRASDETILAVSGAQADLLKRLRQSSPATCRQFVLVGIEHPDRLKKDERQLFDKLLQATEAAYLSGRKGARASEQLIADERAGLLLKNAGFNMSDFQRLQRLSTLGDNEVCQYGLRLLLALPLVRAEVRADLARYLVAR